MSPAKKGWLAGFDAASLELADEVSRRLRGHGLRRGDLKEIVGWSTTGIASFFQGKRDPRYRDLLRILAATQTPPAVFFRALLPLVRSGPAGVPATAFVDAFGKKNGKKDRRPRGSPSLLTFLAMSFAFLAFRPKFDAADDTPERLVAAPLLDQHPLGEAVVAGGACRSERLGARRTRPHRGGQLRTL